MMYKSLDEFFWDAFFGRIDNGEEISFSIEELNDANPDTIDPETRKPKTRGKKSDDVEEI